MNLSKLPPFIAASLGLLGCITAEACLSIGPPETDSITGTGTGTETDTETTYVGPCLSPPLETTSTGPCLGVPMDSSGSDTGSGSGTDTGSGSGSGSDTGSGSGSDSGTSSGGMFDEPHPTARAAAVERVVLREILPADVLDRLRAIVAKAKD
jgi:hypothetical protein